MYCTMACASGMLGTRFEGFHGCQARVWVTERAYPMPVGYLRAAFGERTCFIKDHGIHFVGFFQAFGIADQDIVFSTFPNSYHHSRRCSKAERTWASYYQHRNRREHGLCNGIFTAQQHPHNEGKDGNTDHNGYEYSGNAVGETLNGGFAALGRLNGFDDLCQNRLFTYFFSNEREAAGLVECSCKDIVAGFLFCRDRFAGHEAFVDERAAAENFAVYRDFFARPDNDLVAQDYLARRYFYFGAVAIYPDGLRLQANQLLQCVGSI